MKITTKVLTFLTIIVVASSAVFAILYISFFKSSFEQHSMQTTSEETITHRNIYEDKLELNHITQENIIANLNEVNIDSLNGNNSLGFEYFYIVNKNNQLTYQSPNFGGSFNKEKLLNKDISIMDIRTVSNLVDESTFYYIYRFELDTSILYCFSSINTVDIDIRYGGQNFIISSSGIIVASNDTVESNLFHEIVREENGNIVSSNILNDMQSDILGSSRKILFKGENSYINYQKVNIGGEEAYYFFEAYEISAVTTGFRNVTQSIYLYFFASIVLSVIMLVIEKIILERKIKVIETTKYSYNSVIPVLMTINKSGKILRVSNSFKKIREYEKYKHISDLTIVTKYEDKPIDMVKEQLAFVCELINMDNKKNYYRFVPIVTGYGYQLIGEDITLDFMESIKTASIATHNPISGMPNKLQLETDLLEFIDETAKYKNSIVEILVTNQQGIIKTLGLHTADEFMKNICVQIASLRIDKLSIYHIDSDTIVLLLRNQEGFFEVTNCINRVETVLKRAIKIGPYNLIATLKIGLYNLESDLNLEVITPSDVMRNVELALGRAKQNANYNVVLYDEKLKQTLVEDNKMALDLNLAMKNLDLEVYYQPQFSLTKNKIVGAEALLRCPDPKYNLLSAQKFIEIAEKNGMIIDVGRLVVKSAFKSAKDLEKYNVVVALNVSPAQIVQAGFAYELIEEFKANKLNSKSVAIEITETYLMESFDEVLQKLKAIKQEGIGVHLDDFGTGYSSLQYLQVLPVDTVKIDRTFIKDLETDEASQKIVKQLIVLIHDLKFKVIAEGVETEGQKQILKEMNCDYIQGYLIGKAVPYEKFVDLLRVQEKMDK